MKKSEFYEARRLRWHNDFRQDASFVSTHVNHDLQAAEAAGVVWDPEEEPLTPEICLGQEDGILKIPDPNRSSMRYLTVQEKHEAVRRYNAWKEIQNLCVRAESGHESYIDVVQNIIAILKGEPHG